jgi:hypothetical protein
LRYCEDIATFYRVNIDDSGVKAAAGQCLPSTCPGAYYTKLGEKAQDGKSDREWMCFNPTMDKSQWTNAAAQAMNPPFEGACLFADYDSKTTPDQVDDCDKHLDHHPAVCAPGPATFWGACYSTQSENWKCVPKGDGTIPGLAKGDCKSQVVLDANGAPTKDFFDGVCAFKPEVEKKYKCDTVPGYSAQKSSTCGNTDSDKACFALDNTVWQCFPKDQDPGQPCDWTVMPGDSKKFYRGYCVFNGNPDYSNALDAKNLTKAVRNHAIHNRVVV